MIVETGLFVNLGSCHTVGAHQMPYKLLETRKEDPEMAEVKVGMVTTFFLELVVESMQRKCARSQEILLTLRYQIGSGAAIRSTKSPISRERPMDSHSERFE